VINWLWKNISIETRVVIWVLLPYSLYCCVLSIFGKFDTGIDKAITGVEYQAYWDQFNWFGYPLFFIAVVPLLHWAGASFLKAWGSLSDTGVLTKNGTKLSTSEQKGLLRHINCWRWPICLIFAAMLSCFLMNSDAEKINAALAIENGVAKQTYKEQMEYACNKPDFFVKWLFDTWKEQNVKAPVVAACFEEKKDVNGKAVKRWVFNGDSELGKRIGGDYIKIPPEQVKLKNRLYVQQFALVFIGAWVLFQLLLYPILFAFFNRLPYAQKRGLNIGLNSQSSLKEFGLEHWNQVLNNIYWALSLALIAPIASRMNQVNPNDMDKGQQLISIWIPVLLLAPMIANITARQAHLPVVWQRLASDESLDAKEYHEQRLWPLDRNWSSKLGIIVAFALASFFLSVEIIKVII